MVYIIYLTPFARLPLDRAVDHVAVLLGSGRRLRAEVGADGQGIATAAGNFVDTMDVASLDAAAARPAARGKVGRVPPWRARHVVAGPGNRVRPPLHRAQMRTDPLAVLLPDAFNNRLLDS
jgi:hypothetical protein